MQSLSPRRTTKTQCRDSFVERWVVEQVPKRDLLTCWSSLELLTLRWLPLWYGFTCVTSAWPEPKTGARCPEPPTRQEEVTQSRRGRLTQRSGTAPRHIWVQSQSGRACVVPWMAGFGYGPPSCVRYCPVTTGVRQC